MPGTTTTYSLGTVGGNSGLVDTLTGQTVVLSKDGNDIVGTINSGTTTVIRISVSAAGVVTFTQSPAVEQANPASHDESIALAATANLITLTATVTDGDQDKGALTRDITSSFMIQDDGPTVALALNAGQQVVVDETIGQNPGENETGSLGSVTVLGPASPPRPSVSARTERLTRTMMASPTRNRRPSPWQSTVSTRRRV